MHEKRVQRTSHTCPGHTRGPLPNPRNALSTWRMLRSSSPPIMPLPSKASVRSDSIHLIKIHRRAMHLRQYLPPQPCLGGSCALTGCDSHISEGLTMKKTRPSDFEWGSRGVDTCSKQISEFSLNNPFGTRFLYIYIKLNIQIEIRF